jgi:hypothetical protein
LSRNGATTALTAAGTRYSDDAARQAPYVVTRRAA